MHILPQFTAFMSKPGASIPRILEQCSAHSLIPKLAYHLEGRRPASIHRPPTGGKVAAAPIARATSLKGPECVVLMPESTRRLKGPESVVLMPESTRRPNAGLIAMPLKMNIAPC